MRRPILVLVVAVLVALIGAGVVFVGMQWREEVVEEEVAAEYRERYGLRPVAVALEELRPGEVVSDAVADGRIVAAERSADAVGDSGLGMADLLDPATATLVVTDTIGAGEVITSTRLGDSPPSGLPDAEGDGVLTVALDSDAARVGGLLTAGDRVAVLVTEGGTRTCVVASPVRVLAVGSTTGSAAAAESGRAVSPLLVTMDVDPTLGLRLRHAQALGALHLIGLPGDAGGFRAGACAAREDVLPDPPGSRP